MEWLYKVVFHVTRRLLDQGRLQWSVFFRSYFLIISSFPCVLLRILKLTTKWSRLLGCSLRCTHTPPNGILLGLFPLSAFKSLLFEALCDSLPRAQRHIMHWLAFMKNEWIYTNIYCSIFPISVPSHNTSTLITPASTSNIPIPMLSIPRFKLGVFLGKFFAAQQKNILYPTFKNFTCWNKHCLKDEQDLGHLILTMNKAATSAHLASSTWGHCPGKI